MRTRSSALVIRILPRASAIVSVLIGIVRNQHCVTIIGIGIAFIIAVALIEIAKYIRYHCKSSNTHTTYVSHLGVHSERTRFGALFIRHLPRATAIVAVVPRLVGTTIARTTLATSSTVCRARTAPAILRAAEVVGTCNAIALCTAPVLCISAACSSTTNDGK